MHWRRALSSVLHAVPDAPSFSKNDLGETTEERGIPQDCQHFLIFKLMLRVQDGLYLKLNQVLIHRPKSQTLAGHLRPYCSDLPKCGQNIHPASDIRQVLSISPRSRPGLRLPMLRT